MSARPGNLSTDAALPSLATHDASAAPHILTVPARTGTNIELRIHTSLTPFDVATENGFLAAADFVVTVIVHTLDATTGGTRYLPPPEPAEWARAIFSTAGAAHGYFLGAVDPKTGTHRRATRLPPLPRHRPAADTRATAADHLTALPPTWPRRQSRDHHSHHGLTPP